MARPELRVFEPRLLKLLTFLTRRQASLSAPEIAHAFRLDGRRVSLNTVYRWFDFLEERVGLAYFPLPRMNLLGLADVHVTLRGLRSPSVLSAMPWGHSFLVEVGLDGRPFLSVDYWVPGPHLRAFREYWNAVTDLGLVQDVAVLPVRNVHYLFSAFHELLSEDGIVRLRGGLDNAHFRDLIRRHLREAYEVRIGERIAASPIVVPVVLEHLWRHSSSRHVWQALRAKRESFKRFAKLRDAKALEKPGSALRLLQTQWRNLLDHFEEVFLQPVVFWPPGLLVNSPVVSFTIRAKSEDHMVEAALQASERSVMAALMPEPSGRYARIWCTPPSDQLPAILRLAAESHHDATPPVVGIVDIEATRRSVQPAFGGFDWGAFDPQALEWRYEGESYQERLKDLRPARSPITQ